MDFLLNSNVQLNKSSLHLSAMSSRRLCHITRHFIFHLIWQHILGWTFMFPRGSGCSMNFPASVFVWLLKHKCLPDTSAFPVLRLVSLGRCYAPVHNYSADLCYHFFRWWELSPSLWSLLGPGIDTSFCWTGLAHPVSIVYMPLNFPVFIVFHHSFVSKAERNPFYFRWTYNPSPPF